MMNDKGFENKVNRDVNKVKKDIATLGDDGVTGLSRIFEPLADDAKKTVTAAVETLNKEVGHGLKEVGHGLSQYNAKAQHLANRAPGDLGKMAAKYPWVTITLSLALGLLLGVILFRPGRQSV